MIITIDGPSATGKTTIARRVAQKLGWRYFDTGAMYRAVTYSLLQKKISLEDQKSIENFLDHFIFDVRMEKEGPHYYVNNEEVTEAIRSPEVNAHVSEVAANGAVRASLLSIQHNFAKGQRVVFEGRDMGTTVFPDAEIKIFLTASAAVRAERRYLELKVKHPEYSETEVMENLLKRDETDSSRELSPLKQAEDAHLIDTSELTIDAVIEKIFLFVQAEGER